MGHQDKVKKLGRTKSHRDAMLANMAMSLFEHRMIKTTEAKAKALRPVVDRLISTAKQGTLAAKREVARTVHQKEVFKKLFTEIVPQFADRDSGFTRVMKLGVRRGDGAPISVVELLTEKPPEKEVKKKKKGAKESLTSRMAKTR
jgi:large subunit ribosomal protein L17